MVRRSGLLPDLHVRKSVTQAEGAARVGDPHEACLPNMNVVSWRPQRPGGWDTATPGRAEPWHSQAGTHTRVSQTRGAMAREDDGPGGGNKALNLGHGEKRPGWDAEDGLVSGCGEGSQAVLGLAERGSPEWGASGGEEAGGSEGGGLSQV